MDFTKEKKIEIKTLNEIEKLENEKNMPYESNLLEKLKVFPIRKA